MMDSSPVVAKVKLCGAAYPFRFDGRHLLDPRHDLEPDYLIWKWRVGSGGCCLRRRGPDMKRFGSRTYGLHKIYVYRAFDAPSDRQIQEFLLYEYLGMGKFYRPGSRITYQNDRYCGMRRRRVLSHSKMRPEINEHRGETSLTRRTTRK